MSEPTNADRCAWAEEAIRGLVGRTRCDYDSALCDLLADLMHWAAAHALDFDDALDQAREHFAAEVEEELIGPSD
jgi:hypothetical protein